MVLRAYPLKIAQQEHIAILVKDSVWHALLVPIAKKEHQFVSRVLLGIHVMIQSKAHSHVIQDNTGTMGERYLMVLLIS